MVKYNINQLKDNDFSLVLSGGSAYGFVHLGIIKFLEENNLKPKEIIGTSMGSLIGALYAFGYTYDELEKITTDIKYLKLIDFNISNPSILEVKKVLEYLELLFKKKQIKNTKINLKIITTNLKSGEPRLFSKESDILISNAVISSMSIPGLFPPFEYQNEYFTDGFVCSNLPIEFANIKNTILAIDAYNSTILKSSINKVNFKVYNKISNMNKILKQSINLMIINQTRDKLKNYKNILLIKPDVSDFEMYNFNKWKEIENIGYLTIVDAFK